MTAAAEARARAIEWARSVVADPSAVVLDTETTSLGDDAEVCDLGVVRIDGTVLLDALVRPTRPIPPGATRVHGITDAMVAGAEPWEVVHERLVMATPARVVVYNRDYDLGVIDRLCARHGLPGFGRTGRWECAMRAFADFLGVPGRFPGQPKWHKLDDAAAHFGVPPGGHRALADAETARRVVLAMAVADRGSPQPAADGRRAVQASMFGRSDPDRFTR